MLTSDTRDIVITRILNAPVSTVWTLWTNPKAVTRWWGPEDYSSPSAKIDLREGGSYLFAMRSPAEQGGAVSYTGGVYKRIDPLERLEFTQNLTNAVGEPLPDDELPAGFSQDVHTIVELRDVHGLTELTITEKGWTKSLMSVFAYAGMHQSLDKMADRLADQEVSA
ncbi:SRPBCC domain-containing protein [Paeniglutamicibacter antarcticus]|uniref:SRPBCC domain-containing protein n=1 Tax=Arthrobacter terrae TaxID=2935737 RepID=A0A931CRL3_9MICC|nr:SRPBCC domain-containing protein [Arthrobacter terrae]MBG0741140.1 SRPBCC domain-containing protein [Arthrobacter terrae]